MKIWVGIIFFVISTVAAAQNKRAEKLYNDAMNVLQEGEESLAMDKLQLALEYDSNFSKARYNLGLLYRELGKYNLAEEQFSILIRQQAAFPKAYVLRGKIRLEAGKTDSALADFQKAVLMYPNDYDAWHGMGTAHFMFENYEGAEEFFSKALLIFPEFPACYNDRASARMMLGKFSEALEDYRYAVAFMPLSARYHNNLGSLYLRLGREAEARAEFTKALEIGDEPDISVNMLMLCDIAQERTQNDSLQSDWPVFHLNRSNVFALQGISDQAMKENTIASATDDPDLKDYTCLQKVRLLIAMKFYEQACSELKNCPLASEYKKLVCK